MPQIRVSTFSGSLISFPTDSTFDSLQHTAREFVLSRCGRSRIGIVGRVGILPACSLLFETTALPDQSPTERSAKRTTVARDNLAPAMIVLRSSNARVLQHEHVVQPIELENLRHLGLGERTVEKIALDRVTALRSEKLQLLRSLHPLYHHFQVSGYVPWR